MGSVSDGWVGRWPAQAGGAAAAGLEAPPIPTHAWCSRGGTLPGLVRADQLPTMERPAAVRKAAATPSQLLPEGKTSQNGMLL